MKIEAMTSAAPATRKAMREEAKDLRAAIEQAVTKFCELAEEIQQRDQETAERIWDIAHEHLELALINIPRA